MKQFKFNLALFITLAIMLIPMLTPVFASDITGAVYVGTLNVNSTSAQSNKIANFNLTTSQMISDGFINASCNNTAIRTSGGSDIAYMPAYGTNSTWYVFVPSLTANVTTQYNLYTGGPDMNSTQVAFLTGSGLTIDRVGGGAGPANSTAPGGGNTSIELQGYFTVNGLASYNLNTTYLFNYWNPGSESYYKLYLSSANNLTLAYHYNATKHYEIKYFGLSNGTYRIKAIYDLYAAGEPSEKKSLALFVNDVLVNSTPTSGVPALPDWTWYTNANSTTKYLQYLKLWQNDTLRLHTKWQYGGIFYDLSGYNNTVYPVLYSTLNPNITISMSDYEPVINNIYSNATSGEGYNPYPANVTQPGNMFNENLTPGIIGADYLNTMLDAGGIPRSFVWFPLVFGLAIAAGFGAYYIIAKNAGHSATALLVQAIISAAIVGGFSIAGVVPWYCLILFLIEAAAVVLGHKFYGWG